MPRSLEHCWVFIVGLGSVVSSLCSNSNMVKWFNGVARYHLFIRSVFQIVVCKIIVDCLCAFQLDRYAIREIQFKSLGVERGCKEMGICNFTFN